MTITYRRLLPGDLDAYIALRLKAVQEHPEAFIDTPEEVMQAGKPVFKARISQHFIAGAFDGDKLVGMMGYFIHKAKRMRHRGYLYGVYVLPEYRGKQADKQSISTALLAFLIEHAKQHVEHLELSVNANAPHVQKLYSSVGFKEYGRYPKITKLDDGSYIDDIYMWMDLGE